MKTWGVRASINTLPPLYFAPISFTSTEHILPLSLAITRRLLSSRCFDSLPLLAQDAQAFRVYSSCQAVSTPCHQTPLQSPRSRGFGASIRRAAIALSYRGALRLYGEERLIWWGGVSRRWYEGVPLVIGMKERRWQGWDQGGTLGMRERQ